MLKAEERARRAEEINRKISSDKHKIAILTLLGGSITCIYAKKLYIRRFHVMALLIMGSTEAFSPTKCNQYFKGIFTGRYFSDLTRRFIERGWVHKMGKLGRTNLYALTPQGRDLYEKIYKSIRRFMKKNFYGVKSWEKV